MKTATYTGLRLASFKSLDDPVLIQSQTPYRQQLVTCGLQDCGADVTQLVVGSVPPGSAGQVVVLACAAHADAICSALYRGPGLVGREDPGVKPGVDEAWADADYFPAWPCAGTSEDHEHTDHGVCACGWPGVIWGPGDVAEPHCRHHLRRHRRPRRYDYPFD